jgi:hypothetical protein
MGITVILMRKLMNHVLQSFPLLDQIGQTNAAQYESEEFSQCRRVDRLLLSS